MSKGPDHRLRHGNESDASHPNAGGGNADAPLSNPIFTRLSGRKRNQGSSVTGFVIVAIIVTIIVLVGLYFSIGPQAFSGIKGMPHLAKPS